MRRFQKFNGCPGTQIRSTDPDGNKHIGILADAGRGSLDTGKFLFVIVDGQIHPAQKIVSRALAACQQLVGGGHLGLYGAPFMVPDEPVQVAGFQRGRHVLFPRLSSYLMSLFYNR